MRDWAILGAVLIAALGVIAGACEGESSPSPAGVPVRVVLTGQPFTASVQGHVMSADGDVIVTYAPGIHEVAGTFSGPLMSVAFTTPTSAGGVRIGSLSIVDGPGGIPIGISPEQDGCVAVWGGLDPRPQPFRVRFTVTTDAAAACFPAAAGS